MKQFLQQIRNLEDHIQVLSETFEGVKKQLKSLPELIQKENITKSNLIEKPKTPKTDVSENDIDTFTLNIQDYKEFNLNEVQQNKIINIKNFNEYFEILNELDLEKDNSLIKKLIKDKNIQRCSTKNQKNILKFINKLYEKNNNKNIRRLVDNSKKKTLQTKTISIKKQLSLSNMMKPKKYTIDDLKNFYEIQNFEQLNKNLKIDDWKLLHAIIDFDMKYDNQTLQEISIENNYENLKEFCYNYRHELFDTNILEHCKSGNLEAVYYDIKNKVNIDKKDYYGQTGLILSCRKGYDKIVNFLAENGADINLKSNLGQSGYMQACRYGHKKVIDVLLKHRVDTNIKDKYGKTGFIYSCIKGYMDIIQCLIKNKVDYNSKDNYQKTGFDYLSQENKSNLQKFLKDQNIKLDESKLN